MDFDSEKFRVGFTIRSSNEFQMISTQHWQRQSISIRKSSVTRQTTTRMSQRVRLLTLAFDDDEELESEVRNTELAEEEIDFLLEEEEIEQSKYAWIFWVILSSVAFAACNVLISELGREDYLT